MQEHFFKDRGIAYRTNSFVPGRKTLLLVHGLSGSLSAWYPYEKIFENVYNIISFDLRGHGLSVRPPRSGYAMPEFVEDIRALLAHLQVPRCAIVSHSFGTLIAMEFARAHPGLVEKTVYLAPAYGVQHFKITTLLSGLAAMLAMMPLRIRSYRRTDYTRFFPTPDYSVRRIGTDILNMGVRPYLRSLRVIFKQDYDQHWAAVHAPALVVHGARDSIVPVTHGRALAQILPGAVFVEIPAAGHVLVLNNVEEVARLIREFIGQ